MAKRGNRPENERIVWADLARRLSAFAFDVPLGEILAGSRRHAPVAFARQVAMYLSHVAGGLSLTEVGSAFSRDRTTASHACHIVEDRRDDPRLDALIASLENALRTVGQLRVA